MFVGETSPSAEALGYFQGRTLPEGLAGAAGLCYLDMTWLNYPRPLSVILGRR